MAAKATATRKTTDEKRGETKPMGGCTALLAEARKIAIRLVDINEHFTCRLCEGYFRNPLKIKECAHTFCSGCINHYLFRDRRNNSCPTCGLHLGAKPFDALAPDPAIQGLAEKLLPSFEETEAAEQREFYERHGFKRKAASAETGTSGRGTTKRRRSEPEPVVRPSSNSSQPAQPTEKIAFELHPDRSDGPSFWFRLDKLKKPLMLTNASFKIQRLKKYVAMKMKLKSEKQVEILCRNAPLGDDYSLSFVSRTIWADSKKKMVLEYRKTAM